MYNGNLEGKPATIPPPYNCAAVLAGGASKRMGSVDKSFLEIAGKPLVFQILDGLAARFQDLLVVTNRPAAYASYPGNLRITGDILPGFGPLSGLHAALSAANGDWVYLTACDNPSFSSSWLDFLLGEILRTKMGDGAPLAFFASYKAHIEPFHAFYSKKLLPHIENLLAEPTAARWAPPISELLNRVPHKRIPEQAVRRFSPDWALFRNINTAEDWIEFQEVTARGEDKETALRLHGRQEPRRP